VDKFKERAKTNSRITRSVVPVHPEMVVLKNVRRSVDIMQGKLYCWHHALAYACLVVPKGCWKEPGKEDVMLMVSVSVWMYF